MKARFTTQLVLLGTALSLLFGITACNDAVNEACQTQIPAFQKQLDQASSKLFDQVKPTRHSNSGADSGLGRALASSELPLRTRFSIQQKKDWQEWAENRLKEVQKYMDVVQGEVKIGTVHDTVREELSAVAKDLVSVDGFVEVNQARFMEQALEHARQHADNAARLTCHL
jgi:hypothetical protein